MCRRYGHASAAWDPHRPLDRRNLSGVWTEVRLDDIWAARRKTPIRPALTHLLQKLRSCSTPLQLLLFSITPGRYNLQWRSPSSSEDHDFHASCESCSNHCTAKLIGPLRYRIPQGVRPLQSTWAPTFGLILASNPHHHTAALPCCLGSSHLCFEMSGEVEPDSQASITAARSSISQNAHDAQQGL
ncbi:hypothetical protein BCR34DRAFT_292097 [Clohesyomyces aquaticus]|uniref:Uncharacterized protein n=1 Tax=Clohesyomyces aquaticus TaxID=1231657 RepID=A0A1Y2A874_9PLEO|nr:hypothetical protein BCR34DRAFT_292097 [Clohesyomyces aquaticus]